MAAALSHLRILDLSRVLAAPWASQLLADLGAQVIKIERPHRGDDTRAWGPPYARNADGENTHEAAYYLAANRGKQSVTVDIAQAAGQALIRELVCHCDVVLENFKVGALKKYGLDYTSLRSIKPNLIYCSVTGFGQTGPYAERAGYDFMIQGMGGLMSITGASDAEGGSPQKVGVAVADLFTGMYASVAILAALAHRDQTGEGQYIDMALLDCQLAMLANVNMNYLTTGIIPERVGNAHANIVPYQTIACADGWVIVAVGNDSQFAKLCCIAGCPELAQSAAYATNAARVQHRDALLAVLTPIFQQRTMDEWTHALEAAGVPVGPINTLDKVFAHPQIQHRGMKIDLPHPTAGQVPLVACPIKLSATPPQYQHAPPLLGEHTAVVLQRLLGKTDMELAQLRAQKVI